MNHKATFYHVNFFVNKIEQYKCFTYLGEVKYDKLPSFKMITDIRIWITVKIKTVHQLL